MAEEDEVTPEMISAGMYELACWDNDNWNTWEISPEALAAVYRAMTAKKRENFVTELLSHNLYTGS
jgi:hypothetical protein